MMNPEPMDAMRAAHESPPSGALPRVCAVVPAHNRRDKTLRFCDNFARLTYPNRSVVVVDDGSTDGTAAAIRAAHPDVEVVIGDGTLWWSGGTNLGVRHALRRGADYILTINDDCVMEPGFIDELVRVAQRDPRYIVGCRLHCEDRPHEVWSLGTRVVCRGGELFALNHAGRRWEDIRGELPDPLPVDTMPGNGVLLPRAVFERVGFYDERNMPQYHADSDLVLRAREVGFVPVIALRSVLYNHILEKPLVDNRRDLLFSRKSDRYWRAIWTTLGRHGPPGRRCYLMLRQYSPFFLNGRLSSRIKRLVRRLVEPLRKSDSLAIERGYNPTCAAGPTRHG